MSHWPKISAELREAAKADIGEVAVVEITPMAEEPNPAVPVDLETALKASPEALSAWGSISTVARRAKRIADACDMLGSGKRRVCGFDPSGFYSKAFAAPKAAD